METSKFDRADASAVAESRARVLTGLLLHAKLCEGTSEDLGMI